MTAKEHNKLVGIFLMAHGGMQALVIGLVTLIYGVLGVALIAGGRAGEERFVGAAFIGVVLVLAFFTILFTGSQILGGYKLFKERANARTWGIIGSIVSCLSFPIGTAAGVYGLWFLFGEEGKRFYLGGPQSQQMFQAPPPNSWQ
ncbi:MAG: hypothetical protein IPM59_10830 [Chloracidobacterium sp.]|nr:hypothetical protein [Chloracidobacterium sp.]